MGDPTKDKEREKKGKDSKGNSVPSDPKKSGHDAKGKSRPKESWDTGDSGVINGPSTGAGSSKTVSPDVVALLKDPPPSKNKSDGNTAHLLQEVLKDNKATADGLAKVMEAVKKLSEQQQTYTDDAGSDLYNPYENMEDQNEEYEDLGKSFGQDEEASKEDDDEEEAEDVNVADKFGLYSWDCGVHYILTSPGMSSRHPSRTGASSRALAPTLDDSAGQDTGPEIWEDDNYPGTEYSLTPLKRTRSEEPSGSDPSKRLKIASSTSLRSSSVAEQRMVQPAPPPLKKQVSPGLLRLKEKAQSLIKKKGQADRRSVQDVIILDEKSSDNTPASESQQSRKPTSQSDSFLGMTRSGSTRKPSARSLPFSRNDSIVSTASQDSFTSEPDASRAAPLASLEDGEAGKLQFCHNLMVQRRTKVNRLDVGNCGQPRRLDPVVLHEDQVPLSSSLCANIWTCLETESEQRDLERVLDEGWLAALDMLSKVVNEYRFAPSAAIHKVMMEALMTHKDEQVRNTAFKTLSHCLDMKPPGPATPQTAQHYLELFSKIRPHIEQWKFDPNEPWSFLQFVIESCLENSNKTHSCPDEIDPGLQSPGMVLVLKLLTSIIDIDMNNYFDSLVSEDSLPGSYKPLLSSILFPSDSPVWGRRLELLCKFYVKTLSHDGTEEMLVFVRKLIGFSAQLVQLQERAAKNPQSNTSKAGMANYIATHLALESSDEGCLSSDRLWAELYLLQPTWLSALVSGKCLSRTTNVMEREGVPSLRSVINMFVDTKINSQPGLKDIEEVVLTPTKTSTPVVLRLSSQRLSKGGGGMLTPCKPPSTRKVRNVNSKNKFGETPLHIAAKKGQLERLANCLCSPGVNINSRDNNGFTPLHEAVGSNKLEAVRLLLNHSPHSHTLERYFTPTKNTQEPSKKTVDRVDLLAVDTENGMNPVHESVSSDFVDITRLILEKVIQEQARPKSTFPTLNAVMEAETKDGSTMHSLVQSDEMKQLLDTFVGENQENVPPEGGLEVERGDVFGLLLELFLTKYMSLHCLPHTYGMFKEVVVDKVMRAAQEQPGLSQMLNSRQVKWGPCRLEEGLIMAQFGRRPRFELFRTEEVKSRDFKDFEKLIYYKKSLKKMDPLHPLQPFLTLFKVKAT